MLQFGNGWTTSEYEATKIASGVSEYVFDCKSNNDLPTIEGLAFHHGVWRSIFYDRADPKSDVYQTSVGAFCVFRA
jgi:hypothetical protein